MKPGEDPRKDQGDTKTVPNPPPNSDPSAAPGGAGPSNPSGAPPHQPDKK